MKTTIEIFESNQINRYGMIMPIDGLEAQLNQSWNHPLPSSIGHDIHRATGYARGIALHLQPGIARILGAFSVATEEGDMQSVRNVLDSTLSRMANLIDPGDIENLREQLGDSLTSEGKLFPLGGLAFRDDGLARRVFPALFEQQDKDGLIPVSELQYIAPGVFEKDGLLLFAHVFFRRSLSPHNSLNSPFLKRLAKVAEDSSLNVRIALDENVIGHPCTFQETIELEYWWGPRFSGRLDEIEIGVTRHKADDSACHFYGISGAEFWWYEQNGIKSFECEEIRDLNAPSLGKSPSEFGCRFVHSMLDEATGLPTHLDGAIRLYNEDLMLERVDKDIMHFGRRSDYTKLWRVDGPLSVPIWKALINDYYRDNHLVGDYFGGKEEGEEAVRPEVAEIDQIDPIHEFAPGTMSRGDGIHIAISYHPHSEYTSARVIEPTKRCSNGEGWRNYAEACTVELIKLFKRRSEPCEVPKELVIVAFEDMVTNLPLFEHGDVNAVHHACITLKVIHEYCLALKERKDNRMMAFNLSVRFADRDVHFSFAGQLDDMCTWLQSECARLPETVDAIGAWADAAGNWLTKTFSNARNVPPIKNIITRSGLLIIDRRFLEPHEYEVSSPEGRPVLALVKCPSTEPAMPLVKERGLTVARAAIIQKSTCTKCNGSYPECGCIKIVDAGVFQRIKDFENFGMFWTDRPAQS